MLCSDDGHMSVVFEAFEASATSEQVLASESALQWDFPGQAMAIPYKTFQEDDFQQSLAAFLEQSSFETIKHFAAVAVKACATLSEVRDTPNPTLITGALMAILEVHGASHNTLLVRKRVRDTVSFNDAHKPWRRSAFYLVLRVAMQRHLYNLLGQDKGRLYFKTTMCLFLSKLLDDGLRVVPHDVSHFLAQKLANRLAKLELEYGKGAERSTTTHRQIFCTLKYVMETSLSNAVRSIQSYLDDHNEQTSRPIRYIRPTARRGDLRLRLMHSGPVLDQVKQLRSETIPDLVRTQEDMLSLYEGNIDCKPSIAVMSRYLKHFGYEEEMRNRPAKAQGDTDQCLEYANEIESYVSTIGDAYSDYPEFKSRQILVIMELWKAMDEHATKSYPLLARYHPGFVASILDVLELSTLDELDRLHVVQSYISKRCRESFGPGAKTIFDSPDADSYAVRAYDETSDAWVLEEKRIKIEADAEKLLTARRKEWEKKTKRYDALHDESELPDNACPGFETVFHPDGTCEQAHKAPCVKHDLRYQMKQIWIDTYEHPLPESEPEFKAVIFELMCPPAFAAYRDACWLILSTFAHPLPEPSAEEVPLLRAHDRLRKYANSTKCRITLGSPAKSFMRTHWKTSGFPTPFEEICYPFAMTLDYYDSTTRTRTSSARSASFTHLFPLKLAAESPYHSLRHSGNDWPTSNAILARQTQCPQDLATHEFMAGQGLLCGTFSRWLNLLRELGSTNLNFSTDCTSAIVSRLCLQAGPATTDDSLRDVHSIFHDHTFCLRLLEQVESRLEIIRRNWRESVQLDILTSIVLRVAAMNSSISVCTLVMKLIAKVRDIAQGWYKNQNAATDESESGPSIFFVWAALLYKRTVYPLLVSEHGVSPRIMTDFIIVSIMLQNCLVGGFDVLPHNLRNAILRDLHSAWTVRHQLQAVVVSDRRPLLEALEAFWPVPSETSHRPYLAPIPWWVVITVSTEHAVQHHVHYNILYGTLLIDGNQLGVLPPEYRCWPILQELLGNQMLTSFPSPLPGMSLVVSRQFPYNHWIHLGFRGDRLIIRAEQRGTHGKKIFELIDRTLFRDDLPIPLTANCYHWVDMATKTMEIRQQDPFKSKPSNWRLDLDTRLASRNNGSTLVDPHSERAREIAKNFQFFEYPRMIIVYKPPKGNLRVELQRLELYFVVLSSGLLLCPQLGAVIAETRYQNIGTWHGLRSKLVMRSLQHMQFSVLLPMGKHVVERDGPHVSIVVMNKGEYLKFDVNNVLGRIDCPAEPLMMYYKALWHALTAQCTADSLTGRTGVEEALQYLTSGAYRPWTPLTSSARDLLLKIAELTPRRQFYPPNLKKMESVAWNPTMTVYIQDDRYRRVVNNILQRNSQLLEFSPPYTSGTLSPSVPGLEHLENRALSRSPGYLCRRDRKYTRRDGRLAEAEYSNLTSIARTLLYDSDHVIRNVQVASSLENVSLIGGYVKDFDIIQFTELLEADPALNWGPLVMTALRSSHKERFQMTFLFCLLALSSKADMQLLQGILAFALLPELKGLELPNASSYAHLRLHEVPTVDSLMTSMDEAKQVYTPRANANPKQVWKHKSKHERNAAKAHRAFAVSILEQWLSGELNEDLLATVDDTVFDRGQALDLVRPAWRRLVDNYNFSRHIEEVQTILCQHSEVSRTDSQARPRLGSSQLSLYPSVMRNGEISSFQDILAKDIPPITVKSSYSSRLANPKAFRLPNVMKRSTVNPDVPPHIRELNELVASYEHSASLVHKRYAVELKDSIKALSKHLRQPEAPPEPFNPTKLASDLSKANNTWRTILDQIRNALRQQDVQANWLNIVGLWPKITVRTLLSELRSTSGAKFGLGVKEAIIELGIAITEYQRLLRIQGAGPNHRPQQLFDECGNSGHTTWAPREHIDWLILEVDNDLMLRPEQVDVALATISPKAGKNSVVQLLMGKGKTSCILRKFIDPRVLTCLLIFAPAMVALELTRGNLFRIIVPRPLLLQSAQIMQAKLGGLLNREVLHVPFSRKTPTNEQSMRAYDKLHRDVQSREGIVLALPEHILSFRLSGIQRLCDGKVEEAALMIKTQAHFDQHARDVLDECDVTLGIRTQLIYPSGSQQTVDGHPSRWQTVQALLDLVFSYLDDLVHKFPYSIEVVRRAGVPLFYFLREDVEKYLLDQMVQKICRGQTSILPMRNFPRRSQQDIHDFITVPLVDAEVTSRVMTMFGEKRHLTDVALHLRGLFVYGILLSTLKKRWNVQYGLHPTRDPIAVPYQVCSALH